MSFFGGVFQAIDEQERLTRLAQELGTAKIKGDTKCLRCGYCCHQRTCIPTPGEAIAIAAFLNMTVMDMVNEFYAIDRGNSGPLYIKPVGMNTMDLAGEMIPDERTYNEGACVFLLDGNTCRIYDARPECARLTKCWDDHSNNGYDPRKAWADTWRDKPDLNDLWLLIHNLSEYVELERSDENAESSDNAGAP